MPQPNQPNLDLALFLSERPRENFHHLASESFGKLRKASESDANINNAYPRLCVTTSIMTSPIMTNPEKCECLKLGKDISSYKTLFFI